MVQVAMKSSVLCLSGLPCEVARRRGLLSHSWLKNDIQARDSGFVLRMREQASLMNARKSFEEKVRPGGLFDNRIADARQLASEMIEGFSPKQLVDDGPLKELSPGARQTIKSVLHDEYLLQTRIEDRVTPMTDAVDDLEAASQLFSAAWFNEPVDSDVVRTRLEHLQTCAAILRDQMANLPEGIVLP